MSRKQTVTYSVVVLSLLVFLQPAAQAERLTLSVWCELEPFVFQEDEYPVSAETAAERMLRAETVISACIGRMSP